MTGQALLAALLASGAFLGGVVEAQETAQAPQGFGEALMRDTFLLTRRIEHVMPDGGIIAVSRTYRIRAYSLDDGWMVDGEPVDVVVEAPAHLAAYARLEEQRDDRGTFPMYLGTSGSLIPYREARGTDRAALVAASHLIARQIATSFDSADAERAGATLQTLNRQIAGQRTAWPRDLFRPAAASSMVERALPGGTAVIEIEAESEDGSGLMQSFERRVTTRIGSSERTVRETWEMRRADRQ